MSEKETQPYSQIILAIIFAILGCFFAWLTCYDVQAGLLSNKYLTTPGTVTSFNDGGGRRVPNFSFSYKVNGVEHLNYLDGYPLPSVPSRKYAVGESVRVFYDPANPSHACLKQGLDQIRVAGLILVSLSSLAGAIICFISAKIKT